MPKPAVYMALRQLALSLSKTLLDASLVFEELSKEDPEGVGAAVLGEMMAKATEVQAAVTEAVAPSPAPATIPLAASAPSIAEEEGDENAIVPHGKNEHYEPVARAAKELNVSEHELFRLIAHGKLKRYTSQTSGLACVYRSEAAQALTLRTRRLKPLPDGLLRVSDAAAELQISVGTVYNLISEGAVECVRDPRGVGISREALDKYKRWKGLPVSDSAAAAPVVVPVENTIEQRLVNTLNTLEEEINELESCLLDMSPLDRTATVSGWAGQTRKILFDEPSAETRARADELLIKLRSVARRHRIWVAALIPGWEIEDWSLYIRATSAVKQPLSKEEEEVFEEGNLRALIAHPQDVSDSLAQSIIEQARIALGERSALLHQARKRFPPPEQQLSLVPPDPEPINHVVKFSEEVPTAECLEAKVKTPEVVAPVEEVPAAPLVLEATPEVSVPVAIEEDPVALERLVPVPSHIVAKTEGKRMLIVGGQGTRDAYKENYLERLQLKSCEWLTQERHAESLVRAQGRVSLRNYDMLVYLAHFTSHAAKKLVTVAKKNRLPVVIIPRGYSVTSIAQAIDGQYTDPTVKMSVVKKPLVKPTLKLVTKKITPIKKKTVTKRPAERRHHA